MIRVAVVDDIEITSRAIKMAIEEYDFGISIEVHAFTSGADMLRNEIQKHYDILILDIELTKEHQKTEENGMYLATKVKDMYPDTPIIYITGTICHVKEALQHEPFRYLQKPVEMEMICQAVQSAIDRIMNSADQILFFQMGGVSFGANMKRIKYFESNRRKITVHSVDEQFDYYEKMNDLEKRVKVLMNCFLRVGKSYLVNMQHIKKISKQRVELFDETIIPVSRQYKKEVIQQYCHYINSRKQQFDTIYRKKTDKNP